MNCVLCPACYCTFQGFPLLSRGIVIPGIGDASTYGRKSSYTRRTPFTLLREVMRNAVTVNVRCRKQKVSPGTLLQGLPLGIAYNQQDRRRASDRGRATRGKRCMDTTNTPVPAVVNPDTPLHTFRYTGYIPVLVLLLCTTNTSGGGRAMEGERCMYTAIQQYLE